MRAVRKASSRPKESKGYSTIIIISWILVFFWFGFLIYCWRAGLLASVTLPSFTRGEENGFTDGTSFSADSQVVSRGPGVDIGSTIVQAKNDVHVIFSTDCSTYQDWQSLLVFHSAMAVGQKGHITRIASGCAEEKKSALTELYHKLWPNYSVHFTPDFKKDEKTKKKYDFYNKPYGLRHWLQNAEPPLDNNVVIALIDPDFVFMRPLSTQVKGQLSNLISPPWKVEEIWEKAEKGKPVGQTYGLGAPWVNDNHPKFGRGRICGENSPCIDVPNEREGGKYYSLGPPYIVQKEDMVRIADSWCNFVPKVYEKYPHLLAEMYAYSMAAAHENLPHLRMDNFMVSNTEAGGEGWQLVDSLEDPCALPVDGIFFPDKPLPTFLHYCQFFRVGEWAWGKRRMDKEIFSCDRPILADLPKDLGSYDFIINKKGQKEHQSPRQTKRNAFMICTAYRAMNAALLDFKTRVCGPEANVQKTINIAKLPTG